MAINQIKSGAILSYLTIFLGTMISIVYTPIMLRMLGQGEYGLISLSQSVVGYLGLLNLGLGSAMVRYITRYKAEENKEMEYGVMTLFLKIFGFLSLVILLVGTLLVFNIHGLFSQSLTEEEFSKLQKLMILMTFNVAMSMISSVFYAVMMAYERFVFTKAVGIINIVINPLIMLPLLFLGSKSVGITIASTMLNLINVVVVVYYVFGILKVRIKHVKFERSFLRELFGFSFYVLFALIVDKVYWGTDQFILGAVAGTVVVAVYNIGANFVSYYMQFSTAITGMFLPRLTTMDVTHVSDTEFSDLFTKVGRLQYLILAFVLTGFILLGKRFIVLWAGLDYEESYYIALFVLIPFTIPLIQNLGLQMMYARNLHKFRSLVLFGIAILNVCISIPMARIYGGLGCAAVTGGTFILGQFFILNWFYKVKMRIDIFKFWKEIGKLIICTCVILVISYYVCSFMVVNTWLYLFINAFLYAIIYVIIMWFWGMNAYEKSLINYFRR